MRLCVQRNISVWHVYIRKRERCWTHIQYRSKTATLHKQSRTNWEIYHMLSRLVLQPKHGHLLAKQRSHFKTQKHFWLWFKVKLSILCIWSVELSAELANDIFLEWSLILYRHFIQCFTMWTLYPSGVSFRHSPNTKQLSFCGKYQNPILWQERSKLFVGQILHIFEIEKGIPTSHFWE